VTLMLVHFHGFNPLLAFFLGTLVNELVHHVYYHVVYVNQEIKLRTPLMIQAHAVCDRRRRRRGAAVVCDAIVAFAAGNGRCLSRW
jgi:hypothetical protein